MNYARSACTLAPSDPWRLDFGSTPAAYARHAELVDALARGDAPAAWARTQGLRTPPPRHICTALLQVAPTGRAARAWAPRALAFADRLRAHGVQLNSAEYACLLKLARQGAPPRALSVWEQAVADGATRNVSLWNQYLTVVCDGDAKRWPWRRRGVTRPGEPLQPPEHVLELMVGSGVRPNAHTLETVLAALGRGGAERLVEARSVLATMRALRLRVSVRTLLALVRAYAFNDAFAPGFAAAMREAQEHAALRRQLARPAAACFWHTCLRQAIVAGVKTGLFEQVYEHMRRLQFQPDWGALAMCVEYLERRCRFDDMFALLPEIAALGPRGAKLAGSDLQRLVTGLANTGNALLALRRLLDAEAMGVRPAHDLEPFLAAKGASREQLALFEEDDDEDSVF